MEERYERHEELGRGGIGTVFRGTHTPLQRPVALQEIREVFSLFGDVQKDELVQKFGKAVQRHAKMVHPNIIQLFDIDVERQYPFFVMEFATGGSLRRILTSQDKPPIGERLKIFLQIAAGLKHAHEMGVLHADLKPENVLFDREGNAKLVDFGITQILKTDMGQQQFYIGGGNPAYLAPEQFRNPMEISVQADIYALGLIFYEILTSKLPGRRSPMPSSFFPNIPRKLDDIFDQMCMDDPDDRYDSVAAILEDFTSSEEVMALMGPSGIVGTVSTMVPALASPAPVASSAAPKSVAPVVHAKPVAPVAPISPKTPASMPAMAAPASHTLSSDGAVSAKGKDDDDSSSILSKLDKYGERF